MPSTSRKHQKKALHPKRIEIRDADGWTHVANTHTLSKPNARKRIPIVTADGAADGPADDEIFDPRKEGPVLLPAEAPYRLNHADLRKKFDAHLATWQASVAWQHLRSALLNDVLPKNKDLEDIDNVVCIGLGSPSGFVQGGWVDRRSVALYQLAALVSIIDILKSHQHSFEEKEEKEPESKKKEKYIRPIAQDPVFNRHDTQLLSSLGITVVNTPEGFESITNRTFLFAPGAERRHLQLILPSNPAMVFGGPLEEEPSLNVHHNHNNQTNINKNNDDDCNNNISTTAKDTTSIITRFATRARSVKIADFEPKPETFWRMGIYWRDQAEDRDADSG